MHGKVTHKRTFSVVANDDELKLLCKAFEMKEMETRPGATICGACSWAFRRYKTDGISDSKVIFFPSTTTVSCN